MMKFSQLLRKIARDLEPNHAALVFQAADRLDELQRIRGEWALQDFARIQRLFDAPLPPLDKPDPLTIHDLHYVGLNRSNVKIKRRYGATTYWER